MKLHFIFFVLLSVFCFSLQAQEMPCSEGVTGSSHSNGGGFVANTANVDSASYIGPDSVICGLSTVTYSTVSDFSTVSDSRVSDSIVFDSTVSDSIVSGFSTVSNSTVSDSRVSNFSRVSNSRVSNSRVSESTVISEVVKP